MDINELKAKAETFVGKTLKEEEFKTLQEVAFTLGLVMRAMGPHDMGTMDYRTDRLTLHKDTNNIVTSVLIG